MTSLPKFFTPRLGVFLIPLFVFSGCGLGPSGVEVTQGRNPTGGAAPEIVEVGKPQIVHVDERARLVTIGLNGGDIRGEYLVTRNRAGTRTAALKLAPQRQTGLLATADILEGAPNVNDIVFPADAETRRKLKSTYRSAAAND